jgi:transcription initiation factor TFIID subunit 15
LHRSTRESDLREAFEKYGKLREVALKHTFAFVDFEEHDSAVKAIQEMDRKTFVNGEQILVE